MTKKQKFMIFFLFFASLSLFYDISTSKVFLRQKAIHTTYMHYILSKKLEKNVSYPSPVPTRLHHGISPSRTQAAACSPHTIK